MGREFPYAKNESCTCVICVSLYTNNKRITHVCELSSIIYCMSLYVLLLISITMNVDCSIIDRSTICFDHLATITILLLGSITTIKMHFRDRDLSLAFMKRNFVIDDNLPSITKQIWSLTFLLLITNKSFMKYPPGLVVTRASCYSCVFSKNRRQQEFSVIWYNRELLLSSIFWEYRMKNISNQLCTRNLEIIIIYGNKKKLWTKKWFLPLRVIFLHYRKFTLRQKISNYTSGNWQSRKMKFTCSIYWWNYYCLVSMGVWLTGTSSNKIPPWGNLLQFSWGKLLHCNCNTWGKNEV